MYVCVCVCVCACVRVRASVRVCVCAFSKNKMVLIRLFSIANSPNYKTRESDDVKEYCTVYSLVIQCK